METLTALDLRKKLGSVLDDVANKGKEIVVSRANRPLAVIIPVEEYEKKILNKDREKSLGEIAAMMDAWKLRHKRETKLDVVKAIRDVREGK